jgi:Flp pilus assembly protein TadD
MGSLDRAPGWHLLWAMLAGAALRVFVFLSSRDWIVFRIPVLDAGFYHTSAQDLLTGRWPGAEPYFMGPLFSYLLAAVYALPTADLWTIRVAQMALGLATVAASASIARRLFGPRAAVLTAWLLALYGPLVFYEQLPLIETSATLFAVLLCERAMAWREGAGWRGAIPVGLLLGALVALRGTGVFYVVPVLFLLGSRLRSRYAILALAVMGLTIAPFALHNRGSGSRALTATSLGWNLYVGNHEGATGLFVYPNGWRAETDPTGRTFASQKSGRPLTPDETDAFWRSEAVRFVRDHPGEAAALAFRKLGLFFQGEEIPQDENYRFFLRNVPIGRAGVVGWWLAVPLAIASFFFLRVRSRQTWALVGFALVPAVVCTLFFVTARYRLPAVPFLVVLGSGGLAAWFHARRAGVREYAGAAFILGGAVALLVLPPPYDRARALAREFEHVGLRYQSEGSFWTAEDHYRRALELNPSDGDAWNNLGTVLTRMEKLPAAEAAFQEAARQQPMNPVPLMNLGLLRGNQRDHAAAESYFRRASAIDPRNVEILLNLGTSLAVQERLGEAVEVFEQALQIDPTNTTAREMLLSARELHETLGARSAMR